MEEKVKISLIAGGILDIADAVVRADKLGVDTSNWVVTNALRTMSEILQPYEENLKDINKRLDKLEGNTKSDEVEPQKDITAQHKLHDIYRILENYKKHWISGCDNCANYIFNDNRCLAGGKLNEACICTEFLSKNGAVEALSRINQILKG